MRQFFPTLEREIKLRKSWKNNWMKCIRIVSFWSSNRLIWTISSKDNSFANQMPEVLREHLQLLKKDQVIYNGCKHTI